MVAAGSHEVLAGMCDQQTPHTGHVWEGDGMKLRRCPGRDYGPAVDWQVLLRELVELDDAGALGGIAAVVRERLFMVRGETPTPEHLLETAYEVLKARDAPDWRDGHVPRLTAHTAALLAAEIDRQAAP